MAAVDLTSDQIDQIVKMRSEQRLPWRLISERLGLSHDAARQAYWRAIPKTTEEDKQAIRDEENAKLDEMELEWSQMLIRNRAEVRDGEIVKPGNDLMVARALDGLEKVHRDRSRLNGANAPVEVDLKATSSDILAKLKGIRGDD